MKKPPQPSKKGEASITHSSAAEYLTFIAASGQGGEAVFADSELEEDSVIRKFRITATDDKSYNTQHYKLPSIIAAGFKVSSGARCSFANGVDQLERCTARQGKIQKFDVVVAKNHLTAHEMTQLCRLVNANLDVAEDMAHRNPSAAAHPLHLHSSPRVWE